MMNYSIKSALSLLVASSLSITSTQADDTSIYLEFEEEGAATYQPNVLFIFDTSGSMGSNITIREDYDPNVDYGSSDDSKIYVWDSSLRYYQTSINASQNSCKAMKDQIAERTASGNGDPTWFGQAGYWQIRSYYSNRWRTVRSTSSFRSNSIVDCKADQGKHGINDSSTDVYTRDYTNSSPYQASNSGAFNWSTIGSRYYVSANYHDYLLTTTTTSRRKIDIMKDEAKDLVDNFDGLNLGLMRFDGSEGGYVIHHFSDITDPTQKTLMKSRIDALPASGNTPLAESLWEAALYYQGKAPFYGTNANRDPNAVSGGEYVTPVINSCQKNHVVLLTDGNPYSDSGRDSNISALTSSCSHRDGASLASDTCLDEMAGHVFDNDIFPDEFEGKQNVVTYTIGFDIDMDLLQQTANKGDGKYYTAGNSTELKAAFTQIIRDITDTSTTFTAPAVTVNAYNNLQHRNELYYAIFQPFAKAAWPGNIKRYQLDSNGDILDVNGQPAVDDGPQGTGFFKTSAKSWWSGDVDGAQVESGGAAEQLSAESTTYVYTGVTAPNNAALNTPTNILSKTNSNITNEMMGLVDTAPDSERENLIDWANGIDVDNSDPKDDFHNFIADPLHTRPVVVTYGGTAANPDDTVFSMTNLGMLHAFDTENGKELFRFMPKSMLPNINKYYQDEATLDKVYGLDGPITVWREESSKDEDVTIEASDGDKVYLYFGMRRGGNKYFALDVTNRSTPKLKWVIEGGQGDFTNLGQTWSAPKLASVNWNCDTNGQNCTKKDVLFFGGGYDAIHDTELTGPSSGDSGSAIFMVDAETGKLLWSAGKSGNLNLAIENSIPSDLTLGDIDGDGATDILFAIDIMGHVWRVDFNKESRSASDFATGAMINDLSGTSGSNLRRFYNGVDAVAFSPRGKPSFFALNVGSGYRSEPKETVIQDRFYVLFHDSVFGAPKNEDGDVEYTKIDDSELFDATDDLADKDTNAENGYYINLSTDNGEKVLSTALTFGGVVFFTTYSTDGIPDRCEVNIGSSKLYGIDILSGEGRINGQRSLNLKHGGIASSPVLIFIGGDGTTVPVLCVGTECFKDGDEGIPLKSDSLLKKTYWLEQNK